jgi:hypothetical protein
MRFGTYMLTCAARDSTREATLDRLATTDWDDDVVVVRDDVGAERPQDRQEQTARRLLERAVADGAGFVLFLEDDLEFNRHLRHNLLCWYPLSVAGPDTHFLASLYDPGVAATEWDSERAFAIADPSCVYGSQAFVLSRATAATVLAGWETVPGMQDIRISRLAAAVGPIHYHRPSLVQHAVGPSTWGGPDHRATDYSADWRAPDVVAA